MLRKFGYSRQNLSSSFCFLFHNLESTNQIIFFLKSYLNNLGYFFKNLFGRVLRILSFFSGSMLKSGNIHVPQKKLLWKFVNGKLSARLCLHFYYMLSSDYVLLFVLSKFMSYNCRVIKLVIMYWLVQENIHPKGVIIRRTAIHFWWLSTKAICWKQYDIIRIICTPLCVRYVWIATQHRFANYLRARHAEHRAI